MNNNVLSVSGEGERERESKQATIVSALSTPTNTRKEIMDRERKRIERYTIYLMKVYRLVVV
jgi:uncharacterized protein YggE